MFHSPIVPGSLGAHPHYGLFSRHTAVLFVRNAVASCLCFAIDMALIWLMVSQLGIDKFVAVTAGFLFANSLNYVLARVIVSLCSGTLVFILNATLNFHEV